MRLLKDKKGLTLVELVVAMAIFSIMAAAITFVFPAILKTFSAANEAAEVNSIVQNIGNEITDDLAKAVDEPWPQEDLATETGSNIIRISTGLTNTVTYKTDDGFLMKKINDGEFQPVLPRTYYKGNTVSVSFSKQAPDSLRETVFSVRNVFLVKVQLVDKNGNIFQRQITVAPPVLNQYF